MEDQSEIRQIPDEIPPRGIPVEKNQEDQISEEGNPVSKDTMDNSLPMNTKEVINDQFEKIVQGRDTETNQDTVDEHTEELNIINKAKDIENVMQGNFLEETAVEKLETAVDDLADIEPTAEIQENLHKDFENEVTGLEVNQNSGDFVFDVDEEDKLDVESMPHVSSTETLDEINSHNNSFTPVEGVLIIGTPIEDSEGYHPQLDGEPTCAQMACEGIIHKHHPHLRDFVSKDSLKQEAINDGAYSERLGEAGTKDFYIKRMLEKYDIPVKQWENANFEDIKHELELGHDIVVGVDAGILWNDINYYKQGHAIRITGIDKDYFGVSNYVYVRDSGNPEIDGMGKISKKRILDAWYPMKNFMISTSNSAKDLVNRK